MKTIKIDIIGSCVTRDAFEFAKNMDNSNKYIVNNYISKTSFISLVSDSIGRDKYNISQENMTDWEFRQIKYDLEKNWVEILKKSDSDIIIVDFIDERYDLYRLDNSYITISNIFKRSKFNTDEHLKKIKRNSNEYNEIWEESIYNYIDLLKSLNKPIIIHKAMWKNTYIKNSINKSVSKSIYIKNILYNIYYGSLQNSKKNIMHFRKKIQKKIELNNYILESYYKATLNTEGFESIEVIKKYHADRGHKWGLAPFHYESGYYEDFINQLESKICKGNLRCEK